MISRKELIIIAGGVVVVAIVVGSLIYMFITPSG